MQNICDISVYCNYSWKKATSPFPYGKYPKCSKRCETKLYSPDTRLFLLLNHLQGCWCNLVLRWGRVRMSPPTWDWSEKVTKFCQTLFTLLRLVITWIIFWIFHIFWNFTFYVILPITKINLCETFFIWNSCLMGLVLRRRTLLSTELKWKTESSSYTFCGYENWNVL